MTGPERIPVDFGDLLIAIAEDLDRIRQCVGCGEDSTWAGLFVSDDGLVDVTAWCDAAPCEHDRTVLSAGHALALPINHLPALRHPRITPPEPMPPPLPDPAIRHPRRLFEEVEE